MSAYMHTCMSWEPCVSLMLECFSVYGVIKWLSEASVTHNEVCFVGGAGRVEGEHWRREVNCTLQFRNGWRWRRSGVRWAAPAWSFAGTVGPSVEGFFRDRPSPETWRSSTHPDRTSYLSDYRSSGERMRDNAANQWTTRMCVMNTLHYSVINCFKHIPLQ